MAKSAKLFYLCEGPRRGIPNTLMERNNQAVHIDPHQLPSPDVAVQMFEANGGHLTIFSPFGNDPLKDHMRLAAEREEKFHEQYPEFQPFFSTVVNGDNSLFRSGLLYFIQLSKHFEVEMLRSST